MEVTLSIKKDIFYNNGRIILNSLPKIESEIKEALSKNVVVDGINRKTKGQGITASSLNKALRDSLTNGVFKGETHVENGIFFSWTKEGFDFASYDEEYNKARLYNYFLGTVGILNGDEKILDINKKLGLKKKEWIDEVNEIKKRTSQNTDCECEKHSLTVVGEFQFGNWALVYRDLFRLLAAVNDPGVDMYIYVAAEESLSSFLSDQIVTYEKTVKIIQDNLSIIKTPIWVIGLGIDK